MLESTEGGKFCRFSKYTLTVRELVKERIPSTRTYLVENRNYSRKLNSKLWFKDIYTKKTSNSPNQRERTRHDLYRQPVMTV